MKKKYLLVVLLFAFMFISGFTTKKVVNPLWENYEKLSDLEKKNWSVIPSKYIYEYEEDSIFKYKMSTLDVIPDSYDLRNVNNVSYVTPLKNQSSFGLCWAFSANASLESNILKLGLATSASPKLYSERQLDYLSANISTAIEESYNPYSYILSGLSEYYGGDRALGSGGSFDHVSAFYASGVTPFEMTGVWSLYNLSTNRMSLKNVMDTDSINYSVTDYVNFPIINNTTDTEDNKLIWRNKIKNHIINYGGVYVGTLAPDTSYSGSCSINDTTNGVSLINWNGLCTYDGTHAMTIIGWNDNYHTTYCALNRTTVNTSYTESYCDSVGGYFVEVNGAWILKNSWGNTLPYPYLAYDSYVMTVNGVKNTVIKDWDNNYDAIDVISGNVTSTSYERVFTKSSTITEKLVRISFEHYSVDKTYNIYLKNGNNSNYSLIDTVTVSLPGMTSVNIDNINLIDNNFSIKITTSTNSEVTNITAFTKDVTVTNNNYAEIQLDNNLYYDSTSESYYYIFDVITRNIDTGSLLTYQIYDEDNNLVNSIFNVPSTYLVNNNALGYIELISNVPVGTYIFKVLRNNIVIGSTTFDFGLGDSGNGSVNDPYLISKASDLEKIDSHIYYASLNYKLGSNIDLTNYNSSLGFNPIGNTVIPFKGTFDGNGYVIKGLYVNTDKLVSTTDIGLFGVVEGATIKNLGLEKSNVVGGNYAGNIVGNGTNVIIDKCYVIYGNVAGTFAGGFIGNSVSSTISNTYYMGNIITDNNEVNLIGNDSSSTINTSYMLANNNKKGIINNNTFTSKTISELKTQSTFNNFNLSTIWGFRTTGTYLTLKVLPYNFVTSIVINDNELDLGLNQTKNIEYVVNPSNYSNTDLVFTSSDSEVVSVTNTGLITAKKAGNAVITISASDYTDVTDTVNVTVSEKDITLGAPVHNPTIIYDKIGGTITTDVTTVNIVDNSNLNVTIKNSNNVDVTSNFTISGNVVNNNTASIVINSPVNNAYGTYTVSVNYGNISKQFTFVITQKINVEDIVLNKNTLILSKGTYETLTYTITPNDTTYQGVIWESSDNTVATVSNRGKVTALKRGNATISVISTDNSSVKDICTVVVKDANITFGNFESSKLIEEDTTKYNIYYGTNFTLGVTYQDVDSVNIKIKNSNSEDVSSKFNISGTTSITISKKSTEDITSGTYTIVVSGSGIEKTKNFDISVINFNKTIFSVDNDLIVLKDTYTKENFEELIGYDDTIYIDSDNTYISTNTNIIFRRNGGDLLTMKIMLYGDVTEDGEIDIYDIIKIKKHILGITEISDATLKKAADIVEDDEIDIYDIIKIRKKILGV